MGKHDADVVTLYRNVESLKEMGLIKQIKLRDRQAYYELSYAPHHHHLICTSCGKLEDVKVREPVLTKTFLKNHGFTRITDHSLEFFGICGACA